MTQRVRFFMLPAEFESFVREAANEYDLQVFLDSHDALRTEWSGNALAPREASWPIRLYLSTKRPASDQLTGPAKPAEWGWIHADAPLEKAGTLYLAELTIGAPRLAVDELPASRIFARMAARLRRRLHAPIGVKNMVTGASRVATSPMYSDGALEHVRSGGRLRQYAVPNIAYEVPHQQHSL
jgi:hypothetical protein